MNLLQVMCKRQVFHLTGKVWTALIEYFLQDFSNALMIKTAAEGHNSGRTYYLQASSKEQCIEMEKLIKSLSTRAREKAAARTQFAKVQLGARKLFSSYWFQTGSATLIIAVCSLAAPRGSNSNSNEINVNWHWHHAARAVPDSPSRQNFLVSIFESQYGRMMTLGNGSAATPSTHISVVDFQERQDDNNTDFNHIILIFIKTLYGSMRNLGDCTRVSVNSSKNVQICTSNIVKMATPRSTPSPLLSTRCLLHPMHTPTPTHTCQIETCGIASSWRAYCRCYRLLLMGAVGRIIIFSLRWPHPSF